MTKRPDPLDSLQAKIDAAREHDAQPKDGPSNPQGMGLAMRLGVELVAGVGVGTAAGYFLDQWLGTIPLFLILCFLLGTAAGFVNLKRTVERLDKEEESATTTRADHS